MTQLLLLLVALLVLGHVPPVGRDRKFHIYIKCPHKCKKKGRIYTYILGNK
uniref:Defensin beta 124 n=1 Tax=Macaca mulatta TaxID=9544 RepID=F7BY87_MACMU